MKPMFSYTTSGAGTAAFDYPLDTVTNTPNTRDFVVLVAGKLQKAAPNSASILGLLEGKYYKGIKVAADTGMVRQDANYVYVMEYVGDVKQTLTDADIGTAFDINDSMQLDLDATIVGQLKVVKYDNATKRAWVQIA